jgi:DNA-binding CsgD family transcriptional regulator
MTVRAMKAGAVEFLTKPYRKNDLLAAIRASIERDRTSRQERLEAGKLRQGYERLTAREREVMAFVVAGLLNKQIAGELATSELTIKFHRSQIAERGRRFAASASRRSLSSKPTGGGVTFESCRTSSNGRSSCVTPRCSRSIRVSSPAKQLTRRRRAHRTARALLTLAIRFGVRPFVAGVSRPLGAARSANPQLHLVRGGPRLGV